MKKLFKMLENLFNISLFVIVIGLLLSLGMSSCMTPYYETGGPGYYQGPGYGGYRGYAPRAHYQPRGSSGLGMYHGPQRCYGRRW
jgi:hypothetical protein